MTRSDDDVKDDVRREIMRHLTELHDRCEELIAARDPFSVHNSIHGLKSLVGQLDTASRRYRQIA